MFPTPDEKEKALLEAAHQELQRFNIHHQLNVGNDGYIHMRGSPYTVFEPVRELPSTGDRRAHWTWAKVGTRKKVLYTCPGCSQILSIAPGRTVNKVGVGSGCMECEKCQWALLGFFLHYHGKREFFKKTK
jgi:hypothetical protein